jgi:hypothetical protein
MGKEARVLGKDKVRSSILRGSTSPAPVVIQKISGFQGLGALVVAGAKNLPADVLDRRIAPYVADLARRTHDALIGEQMQERFATMHQALTRLGKIA